MDFALPTGRAGRFVALGITLLAMALIWFALANPLLRLYADRAEALEQRRTIAHRMALLAGTLPELRRQAEAQAGSGPAPTALLEGASDAIAGAALQQTVQQMAARAGAVISSTETLPAVQVGAYRRIGLRIACSGTWPVIVKLLQSVEQGTPRMLVTDLKVHGRRMFVQPSQVPLESEFTIVGFRAGNSVEGG